MQVCHRCLRMFITNEWVYVIVWNPKTIMNLPVTKTPRCVRCKAISSPSEVLKKLNCNAYTFCFYICLFCCFMISNLVAESSYAFLSKMYTEVQKIKWDNAEQLQVSRKESSLMSVPHKHIQGLRLKVWETVRTLTDVEQS